MLKHADIWSAIDCLAREKGFSPSSLARNAGLDPTTFNRSKRVTPEGRERWPSTESISKILGATNTAIDRFVEMMPSRGKRSPGDATVMFASMSSIADPGLFAERGCPNGARWDAIAAPAIDDPSAFAIEVEGEHLEPIFRDGDILVFSPGTPPRKLDRVMVRTLSGNVIFGILQRRTARRVDLRSFGRGEAVELPAGDVSAIFRLMWASQ